MSRRLLSQLTLFLALAALICPASALGESGGVPQGWQAHRALKARNKTKTAAPAKNVALDSFLETIRKDTERKIEETKRMVEDSAADSGEKSAVAAGKSQGGEVGLELTEKKDQPAKKEAEAKVEEPLGLADDDDSDSDPVASSAPKGEEKKAEVVEGSKTEAKTDAKSEAKGEPSSGTKAGTKSTGKPKKSSKTKTKSATKTTADATTDAKSDTKVEDGTEAKGAAQKASHPDASVDEITQKLDKAIEQELADLGLSDNKNSTAQTNSTADDSDDEPLDIAALEAKLAEGSESLSDGDSDSDEDTLVTDAEEFLYVYDKAGKKRSVKVKKSLTEPIVPPESGKLAANQTYQIRDQVLTHSLEESLWDDEFYAIEIQGVGRLKVEILDGTSKEAKVVRSETVVVTLDDYRTYIVIQDEPSFQYKGATIRIQNTDLADSDLSFMELTLFRTTALDLPFNTPVALFTQFAKEIHTKVFTEPKQKGTNVAKDRFQFCVESSLNLQNLEGKESISMRINYRQREFPSKESYDLKPSANTGNGLLKTISKSQKGFCNETTGPCVYYVTIFVRDVDECTFVPSQIANGDQIRFSQDMLWLDEVETDEVVEYTFVPEVDDWESIFLAFTPIENFSEVLVSVGEKPARDQDFQFKLASGKREDVMVTREQLGAMGLRGKNVHIKMRGLPEGLAATLTIKAMVVQEGQPVYLRPNSSVRSMGVVGELIPYNLDLSKQGTERTDIELVLQTINGRSKIVFKECPESEPDCRLTLEDANRALDLMAGKSTAKGNLYLSAVRKSDPKFSTEYLDMNFICAASELAKTEQDESAISKTCKFAVGVLVVSALEGQKMLHELVIGGASNHLRVKEGKALNVKALPSTITYYKVMLDGAADGTVMLDVKAFVLTGRGMLYLSQTSPYPDKDSHDALIDVAHETASYLKTKTYEVNVTLAEEKGGEGRVVYLTYEAESYSLFDLLVKTTVVQGKAGGEVLPLGTALRRSLNSQSVFTSLRKEAVAHRDFHLDCRAGNATKELQSLEISVSSEVFNLLICVYWVEEWRPTIDLDLPCDYSSRIDYLVLSKEELAKTPGGKFIVSVQQVLSEEDSADPDFDLDFTIAATLNSEESNYKLELPGSSFRGYLSAGHNVRIALDFGAMEESGFLVYSSEDPDMTVRVEAKNDTSTVLLGVLTQDRFGFFVTNPALFKSVYCRPSCALTLLLSTTSVVPGQYLVTYSLDDKPVVLKGGLQYRMPNNVRTYYLYQPGEDQSLSFDAFTYQAQSVVFSKVLDSALVLNNVDYSEEISELKFDMKTDILCSTQLVYSPSELKKVADKFIAFMMEPKFNFRKLPDTTPLEFLTQEDLAQVYVKGKTVKLESHSQVRDTVGVGEIKYYLIEFPREVDFSVATMNVVGNIDLLLERGADIYPTLERFWKRASGTTGEVLTVSREEYAGGLASNVFVVGVLGRSAASFSIVLLADFNKLLKIEFQKIVDVRLEQGKYFYLDYYDAKGTYDSLVYADGSDVEVSLLDYDTKQGQDLISMIQEEKNYFRKMVFRNGDLPLTEINRQGEFKRTHLVLRLLPLTGPATANVLIYDPKLPIEAPAEKRFHFAMNLGTESVFLVKLDRQAQIVDLDVKLFFGKVTVSVTHRPESWKKTLILEDHDQKYTQYEMTNAENDIIVFQQIYVRVHAEKFSKFSILVKPKNKFKQLVDGEPEIVYADPAIETILHFDVTKAMLSHVKALEFEVNSVSYFNDLPELLFMPPEMRESSAGLMISMPVFESVQKNLEDLRQAVYHVIVMEGTYIIKVRANPNKAPVKITAVVNKVKALEENGLYRGSVPREDSEVESYSLYLSETGEFRLVIESCVPIKIQDLLFEPKVEGNNANIDGSLTQTYPYIFIDESQSTVKRELNKISYPFVRGLIIGAGRLNFKINSGENGNIDVNDSAGRSYVMMSEFRPMTKSLILKDYIDIFQDRQTFESFFVYYDFVHSQSNLRLTIRQPAFKMQLLDDYPQLEKVRMRLKIYLFSEDNFTAQIQKCGLSALDNIKKVEQVVTVEFTRAELAQSVSQNIEVVIPDKELEAFDQRTYLNVLCYISARFYENEDEEWQVTLDLKYTNVPYFFLTIKNKHISKYMFQILFMAILLLLVVMIAMVCVFLGNKKKRIQLGRIEASQTQYEDSVVTINSLPTPDERSMFDTSSDTSN
jgi:hypothetical protein